MKTVLMVILVLAQFQASYAQNAISNTSPLKKCAKEVCMEPTFNEGLKRYCEMAATDGFYDHVDDWGPNIQTSEGECWCSCKYDVKGK